MNAQKVTDKELAALEKRLRGVYKAAWKDLKPTVRKYLESFEPRLKKLTADINAGKIIIPASTTAEEYIKNWKLRYIAQGEEWVKLLNECAERATQANKLAAEITSGKLPGIYGINFNASSYDIAVNAGMQYSVYLPESTIKELTKENANNVNFKILGSTGKPHYFDPTIDVPRDYAWNQKKIQKALTSGIIQGKSTPKIAQDFMKVMGNNQKAAIRNARTACTSAQNAGTIDSMRAAQSMGLEVKKKWLATLDGRTRASHGHLDGECIDLDEKFSNGLEFPGDPDGSPGEVYNCRCTMENYYPGISDELSAGKRRSRNDDGTRGMFTGTYDEWKATKIREKTPGGAKGSNEVDLAYIKSTAYKEKFNGATGNRATDRAVYESCKAALTHRNGTNYEDLSLIDSVTGQVLCRTSAKEEGETLYTKTAKSVIANAKNPLICVHNHGTNMPPSGSDLGSAGYRKYTKGFIACHDGAVFMYDTSKSRPFTQGGFDLTVYKYEKQGYNKYDASIKALNDFSDRFGLIWKEL